MKYSIVIPVYNVEKYIGKCLDSLVNQTYSNFEVIIVNDGTKDNSQAIIDKYVKKDKRFKSYIKENGGLSDARNYGVKYASGDYLIFIDSDDYVNTSYLENINEVLKNDTSIDVLKIKLIQVDEEGKEISKEKGFGKNGYISFKEILELEFVEPAWSYVYNLKFFKKKKFTYMKGRIHEDYGLTPEILIKAKKIYYLNYYAYYYVQRANSIMSSDSYEKKIKKMYDTLTQYDRLVALDLSKIEANDRKLYYSFIANGAILKLNIIDGVERKKYLKELRKRKVFKYLIDDTFIRKIKKLLITAFPILYLSINLKANKK